MAILYLVSGFGDAPTDDIWAYDTDLDTWTAQAPAPDDEYQVGTKIPITDDDLFIWSWDHTATASKRVSGVWSSISAKNGTVSVVGAASDRAYLFVTQGVEIGFYSYDPLLNSYDHLADPPVDAGDWNAAAIIVDEDAGYVWAFAGFHATTINPVARYTIATDTWASGGSDDPTIGYRGMFAYGLNDRTVLIAGGYDDLNNPTDAVALFDLDTQTWTTAAALPAPLAECQGAWVGDSFFVFGGWDGAAYTPTGYVYDLNLDSWSTLPAPDFTSDSAGWPAVLGGDSFGPSPTIPEHAANELRAVLYDEDYNEIGQLTIHENSAEWEEQLSEAGLGTVIINAYEPDNTPIANRPQGDQFITFTISASSPPITGTPANAWTLFVEDDEKTRIGETIAARTIQVNGRGPLAIYEDSQVYPTLGYNSFPQQVDMYYDWRHKDFDDSSWIAPTSLLTMSQAQYGITNPTDAARIRYLANVISDPLGDLQMPGNEALLDAAKAEYAALVASATDYWGHSIFLVWSPFFPAGPPPYPDPDIIWASSGSLGDAPVGTCYFRQPVTLPWDGTYVMWLAADNRAVAYLDGVPIGATNSGGTSPDTSGWSDAQSPIWFKATAGDHIFAVEAENTPRSDSVSGNPAGVAWNAFIPGYPVTLDMCIFHSNTGDVVMVEYPGEPPGMTPGQAIRLFVEKAQEHGDLPNVDISSFSDTLDSAGNAWTTTHTVEGEANISTKILTDGLTFFRELGGTYVDLRADRDNPFRLLVYNKNTMNATASGVSFLPEVNLESMRIRRDYKRVNVLIGVTQFGYIEVEDATSVGTYGRHPRRFELGSVDNPFEATRVLTEALARYSNLRDEISVTVDGATGYVDYDLGQTAPTVDSDDNPITERVVAISVRQSKTGRALTTPTLKDLFNP